MPQRAPGKEATVGFGIGGTVCGEASVARPDTLQPLASAILDLEAWLSGTRVPHLFIGGVAVAFLARPRTTNDVDGIVLVPDDGFADFLRSAAKHGFPSRHPDAAAFARSNRVFLLRHARSGVDVGLSAGSLGFEQEIVRKARRVAAFGQSLPIPSAGKGSGLDFLF